ncbi:Major heat shock 70 kDa protein Bb, partial [Tulasnella sp. 408]
MAYDLGGGTPGHSNLPHNRHSPPASSTRPVVPAINPEEISAIVLGKMKETTAAHLGEKVTPAAVTVPVALTTPTSGHQGCQYLLSVEDGDFEVLATAGDTHLDGEDFSAPAAVPTT